MEIKDLTNNFEELTVPEALNVIGGKKLSKSSKKLSKSNSCITPMCADEDTGNAPPPPPLPPLPLPVRP